MPTKYDIDVWRGNTLSRTFRLKNADGSLLDLTGSEFVFRAISGTAELIRKETPSAEISVPTPENGEVLLALAPADTRLLPDGKTARYELERRISATQTTILYGYLNVASWANDDV